MLRRALGSLDYRLKPQHQGGGTPFESIFNKKSARAKRRELIFGIPDAT